MAFLLYVTCHLLPLELTGLGGGGVGVHPFLKNLLPSPWKPFPASLAINSGARDCQRGANTDSAASFELGLAGATRATEVGSGGENRRKGPTEGERDGWKIYNLITPLSRATRV